MIPTEAAPGEIIGPTRRDEVKALLRAVADAHGVNVEAMLGRGRFAALVAARRAAMAMLAAAPWRWSSTQIGALFGRHHSGVLYLLGRTKSGRAILVKRAGEGEAG